MKPDDFNFAVSVEIFYEDTDAAGVVYYANYLKYFERARMKFLEKYGIFVAKLANEQDTAFVVTRAELVYQSPARLGDTVSVHTKITELNKVSLTFDYLVARGDKPIVAGSTKLACVNSGGKIKRIDLRKLGNLEKAIDG